MLFVVLEIVVALTIVGLIVFWVARPPRPPEDSPPEDSKESGEKGRD